MNLPFASLFTLTDEQAMARVCQEDDVEAFAELMKRWQTPIRNLCLRMTGDLQRAEDLTQEAFTRLYQYRKNYQPRGKVSTFVWRIALNLCYDEQRRIKRRGESSLDAEQGDNIVMLESASPAEQTEESERAEIVRRALAKLPEIYRTVLVLRHYEDLKFREIADILEIPEGTVKSRMSEALTQLNRILQPMLSESRAERPSSGGNENERASL
ncbi:MAG: RNA polymerase sigma factor [Verrucomicrobiota bacterium]